MVNAGCGWRIPTTRRGRSLGKTSDKPEILPGNERDCEFNISGMVVDTDPSYAEEVTAALAGIDGVAAVEPMTANRIAIVIEAWTVNDELGVSRIINEIPGVRGVYLAYHNFEKTLVEGPWRGGGLKQKKKDTIPATWG